ncbi:NmrA family protein [Fibrisoma limi BUZ 3]|uniref:NmrA family protein n=1 Tax=Fibrisoma limi BUZ 3 TaxID=1185876 RepID=I2GG41_9BACT|nr:NAD(P)H-binding protein [Fibrisoma limi]CCH52866.1 NmrA family protein [Fibrisoma limi BUZ 3]
MHILLGGTGRVGSVVAQTLLERGESVTIITSKPDKIDEWQRREANVAVVNVLHTQALHEVLKTGNRLFLLNPPAAPSTDTAAEERKTLTSILRALDGSGIEKVVAQSTYGAQPGDRVGDLGVLYEMEQALQNMQVPVSILRAAYFMSNWDMALQTARQDGVVHTFFPTDLKLPMVSPLDIGQVAADLMMEPLSQTGLHYVEGPELYSSTDVANAFANVLEKPVTAIETPPAHWITALTSVGFSQPAAESMAAMTEIVRNQAYELPTSPIRGSITLKEYINELISKGLSN